VDGLRLRQGKLGKRIPIEGSTFSMGEVEPETPKHMPELDGIRGLAILGVFCSHVAAFSGILNLSSPTLMEKILYHLMIPLWGGVDLFFVLSGFLITSILLDTKTSKNYFSSFYVRRVLRIFPIYYLVLTLSLIVGHFSPLIASSLPRWASSKISYFLYLQNCPLFWHGEMDMRGPWGAYWSLAVEEQFYLIWPLVILLCSEKTVIRICYIGTPCALLLRIILYYSYFGNQSGILHLTTSRVDGLLMGAACSVYMLLRKKPVSKGWIIACGSVGSAILGYIAIFHVNELMGTAKWMETLGITGYALLSTALVAVSQHKIPFVQNVLTLRWLQLTGKYSYGIYVYQMFIVLLIQHYLASHAIFEQVAGSYLMFAAKILAMTIVMLVVFIVAKISYDLYETRFLRLKKYFKPLGRAPSVMEMSQNAPVINNLRSDGLEVGDGAV
jgi:peptidoglycan/LPS O-acetylase OafA/YrhL